MIKRFFILLLAIVASVGMSWATTTDLASITDNYTAQDGEILTGTLGVNVKISIADGATVTLLNANINGDKTWTTGDYAGLTCLGDATITIVGTNSVSGFSVDNGYPGIYVPSGKTLIINGTGSLTAQSSTEEAAGIGAGRNTHCGNIEIQSGKITAIAGGEEGAGIGGAFNADCGNITISGGIVTAVGGDCSAGIGGGRRSGSTDAGHCGNILISGGVVSATSGKQAAAIGGGRGNNVKYLSNCGTITITNTALKVYAEQGGEKGSTNTIGAAKYGNCGAVTIGGNTGVINDDPYTYRTKEDGEIVVDYINAIGTVVYTQECKDKIDIARELYDALEDSQKTLVTNYQTLLDAEAAYAALIPQPAPAKLPGAFTINADGDKIVFSKGNLQAKTTDLGANWTWDFAPNQWSLIGDAAANNTINGNKSVSANGTVDLFGWSTAATYYGINKSWNNDDYAGDFVDWGALMGTEWRTLSRAEFRYIVFDRAQAFNKQGKATVNGVSGYIFLPDAWTLPSGLSFTPSPSDYTTNQYDGANWEAMEAAGAVFLPAAGDREGTDIYMYDYGWYWTSTSTVDDKAYYLYFYKTGRDFVEHNRYDAKSVRLVTEAPIPPYEAAIKLINEIPNPVVLTAACKAKIDAARTAYDALSDGDKALVTNIATLTTAEAAFDNVMDIWLSGDCDAILWKDTTLTVKKHAGEGNGAMADYTDYYGDNTAPWFNSHWYNPQPGDIVIKSVTLEEGVTHIGENAFGWMSELKTITIPSSMTSIGEDAFYWSKAVDDIYLTVADPANLTWILPYSADNQFKPEKATLCHVPADLLTAYQEKFGTLNMTFVGDLDPITPLTPEQQQALDAAKGLINAIPSPVVYTPTCKDAIDAARAAYDALTPEMLKQLVSNYATLTAAETTYANLKDVAVVEAKINNIPTLVTLKLATRDSIESARAAYDALTADQKLLVTNYDVLTAAEETLAGLNPGGGAPAGALNGKFTINAGGDQIAFSKGNLQATTTDLGAHWTWGFAANQWNYLGIAVANNKITGNKTVSENGTVDLFGWSTAATYYGINNSDKAVDYIGDFVDWGPNMGAGWRTLTKDEWNYLIENNTKGRATVNDKNGYIFLPNDWSGPAFTPDPDNFTTNVYSGDDWTAMENAGAVFLPSGPARNRTYALIANDAKYSSSTSLNNDTSCVFTIYYNQSQSACTGTNRAYGCMVRLVSEGGGATPLDSAQAVKDLIEAIPAEITLDAACVNAIQAARDAYNALAEATKGALDAATVNKLNQAITDYTALIQAGADAVTAKIAAIPQPVTLKLATRDSIENARAAYDALTADQKLLVSNIDVLEAAEAELATLNPGGGMPAGALSGKFTINESGDQIAFSKGNLQATTTDLGETWTWGFAANQWDLIGNAAANNAVNGNGTVSANGTVDLFGWSTPTTYYGIHNSKNNDYYSSEFREWGENITGATWKTLRPSDWIYIISNRADAAQKQGQATVNGVNGYIFLPDEWELPTGLSFTAKPNNWTANVYEGDDWTAMENAGAVFLPKSPWRAGNAVTTLTAGYYWSSDYNNSYMAMAYSFQEDASIKGTGINRYAGIPVRLVTAGGASPTPLDSAQAVKDLIEAIPAEITTDDACVKAIEDARAAYDALSEAAQGALDAATVQKLTDAEAAYAILIKAEADKVVAKINNIPTPVELKLATRDSIESARAAYEALNAYQKPMVTNYQTLLDAEAALAELNPGVPPATPLDSAQHVKDLIDAIPTPVEYPTSGPAIAAALVAYNQLSDAAKGALDDADVQKMTDAAIQYAALDAIAAIEIIPEKITYDPVIKNAIDVAREKYDALIDASKALVDAEVVEKLTNAEQAWADLVALIEHNVSYIGKDGELKTEKVALLNIPNPAPELNGFEFDQWIVKAGDFLEEGLRIKAVYTPIITTHPVAYDTLMYNGTAQTLIEAGVASDGHIEYRLNEGDWSAELPKADMAAAYVVEYKLVREGHEDYMAGSVTAVIAKAPVTYVAPQAYDTLTYNYNTQVLVTAGQTNDGTIEYSLDPNLLDSWSADLPQAMNAGTYAVYFRVQGDLNHFDSIAPAPVAVMIAKRDIVITAPVAYDTLVYNSLTQALAAAGSADFGTMEYTLTPDNNEGWSADMPQAVDAGTYAVYYRVQGDTNHNGFAASIAATVAKAQLTIMAEDKEVEYGESAPEFTVTFNGWQGQDDASVVSDLKISSVYAAGSSVGTYAIVPGEASALNYAITYVNGALVVTKAVVSVSGAEAQTAKFADGHTGAEVLNAGTLNGIKLNDPLTHVTTAVFSSADVSEHLTITLFYELTGDAALLANYDLQPTSEVFTTEGVIIEPFLPNNTDDPEDKESKVQEGIEVYAYGYCEGDNVGLKYHLNSGKPDQYKIEFEDSRFADVDWTMLDEKGPDGVIYITVPIDVPTGDYKMTVAFRDSRFAWLESQPLNVTFHVNLPETYVRPLFDNTIVLVDTCECFTDIQWYHRADASEQWKPIEGANGHYLHVEGKLTGEYFVKAKMNGVETYTCEQTDMQTLYGAETNKQAKVKAYPNPVVSTTTVSIENSDSYEHSLRIVNLMGIEVKNTTFEGNETVVDMDSYTTGNYTISVDGIVVKVLKK